MSQATILIIDDDADIREIISLYLRMHQYNTIEASDGGSGLEQFKKHKTDLVLLDVTMPGMDGYTVCSQLRHISQVPIVFLSGRWEVEDISNGLELVQMIT